MKKAQRPTLLFWTTNRARTTRGGKAQRSPTTSSKPTDPSPTPLGTRSLKAHSRKQVPLRPERLNGSKHPSHEKPCHYHWHPDQLILRQCHQNHGKKDHPPDQLRKTIALTISTTPTVATSVLRTWCNAWITARRTQSQIGKCKFWLHLQRQYGRTRTLHPVPVPVRPN